VGAGLLLTLLFVLVGPPVAHAQYAEQTGADNPFDGITASSTPAAVDAVVGDFDTDGDADLLTYDGSTERYYENDGTGTFTETTGSANPFRNVFPAFGTRGRTFVRDIDTDGDLDLVTFDYSGDGSGTLVLIENTDGSTYTPQTGSDNPFDGITVSGNPATVDAVMGDFGGDDAPDLLVYDGSTERYYENDGTGTFTEQTGSANPFDGVSPAFGTKATTLVRDFDGDGDVDLAFRDGTGDATAWKYREHTSSGFVARTGSANPLNDVAADATAKSLAATAGDFDLDGMGELVTFDDGTQRFYDGDGSGTYIEQTGNENPFEGTAPALLTAATTSARDLEGDGDIDLVWPDPDALRFVERVDAAVTLTDGRNDDNGGVDYTPPAQKPGTDANPVGRFALQTSGLSASLRSVTVTLNATGVQGVEAVELWRSGNNTFSADADTRITPEATYAPAVTFDEVTLPVSTDEQYVFVVVDLTTDAGGALAPVLSSEVALSLAGGAIAMVNQTETSTFTDAYLSTELAPLPVELASFEGRATGQGVRLTWKTASEQNNAGFRVERKDEGREARSGWAEVGFVEGEGATSKPQRYRFTDAKVPYAADTLRYRLWQVDTDGSTSVTEPVTVARGGPDGLELLGTAPNPARQRATVRYGVPESAEGTVRLRLYDVLGRRVRTAEAAAEAGRHRQALDVSGLPSGVYVLRLTAGGQAVTRKLTVVK
jgi:hypothetical protein